MTPLRIIFMGTPDLAAVSLAALLRAPALEIIAAVTQPDRPKGRSLQPAASPVKTLALAAGTKVLQPLRARDEHFIAQLASLKPDLIAVAAFGQILPQAILDIPRFGCLNVHTSLLPRWRGASPIQSAILHGDESTGVTIMKMDAGLDTGHILTQRATLIESRDNAQTLHDRLAVIGAELLVETVCELIAGRIEPRPQPAIGITHAAKNRKEDGLIRWNDSAAHIWNRFRAFTPWPGAFTFLPEASQRPLLKLCEADPTEATGAPGTILRADKSGILVACGDGALNIISLQREGGRQMTAGEFLAGFALKPGEVFQQSSTNQK
jgi:methionyl-tRNA formyltransferase